MRTDSMAWRFLAALLTFVSLTGQAAENPPEAALALADAIEVTEGAKRILLVKIVSGINRGENTQQEADCLRAADFSDIRAGYAEVFAASLSDAEIDAARKFFSSENGRRYAQTWSLQSFKPLTDQDYADVGGFLATEAGRKLLLVLMDEKMFIDRLLLRVTSVLDRCMEKPSVAKFFDRVAPVTPGASADPSPPASKEALRQLIRAMRDDEAVVLAFQQQLPAYGNQISKRKAACVAGIKPAQLTDALASGIAGQLSSVDVADALAFYESKAGHGFAQATIDQFLHPPGPDQRDTEYILRYMTPYELLEMKEFVKNPVARKLMVDKVTQQKSVFDQVQRRFFELVQECASKPAGDR